MLDNLSSRFQKILRDLRGEGRISERHLKESLREIRIALLEADVHFMVVKEFITRIRAKALGQEVVQSLSPGQQVIKIVRDELIGLLGGNPASLDFSKVPPTVILLVGLQGSGKTTTTGKLALWLSRQGHRPFMVSTDVYRPAAMKQLAVIGQEINMPVLPEQESADPEDLAKRAFQHCRSGGFDVLLIDTAGRLHVNKGLMEELERMQSSLRPREILLVADAMTGQDAVRSASDFNRCLDLSGVILTKMDGDARGGAALSIKSVTGKPIKFTGIGEKYDALEVFHPNRMAGRILGMGDVLSLIEKSEEAIDQVKARKMLEKIRQHEFTLEDFRDQLRQIRRLGPLDQILGMLPQRGPFRALEKIQVDDRTLVHAEAVINSMTRDERVNHKLINGARRRRIALGSGQPVSEVNRFLKRYVEAKQMMNKLGKVFLTKG